MSYLPGSNVLDLIEMLGPKFVIQNRKIKIRKIRHLRIIQLDSLLCDQDLCVFTCTLMCIFVLYPMSNPKLFTEHFAR